jgi:hypothetical protein
MIVPHSKRALSRLLSTMAGALLLLLFTSGSAKAAISILMRSPTPGQIVSSTTLPVTATVSSTYALKSVQAQVQGNVASLTYNGSAWSGSLSLAGVALGPQTVTVTATDTMNDVASSQVTFTYDTGPVLTVSSPVRWEVARPTIAIDASCTNCTGILVQYLINGESRGMVASTNGTSLNQVVDMSSGPGYGPFDGTVGQLEITATNADNLLRSAYVDIEVDGSPNLSVVEEVNGLIYDFDCTRMLLIAPDGQTLQLYDRQTHQYTTIVSDLSDAQAGHLVVAKLTPNGAIFSSYRPTTGTDSVREWAGGQLASLGSIYPANSLVVANGRAIWVSGSGIGAGTLQLRDLVAETTTPISAIAGGSFGSCGQDEDLAGNGDIVFGDTSGQVDRWRSGSVSTLTHDPLTPSGCPLTDGTNVVYESANAVDLVDSTGAVSTLVPARQSGAYSQPISTGKDYQVAGGWIAYTASAGGATQVFLRDPSGAENQVSIWGSDTGIDDLELGGVVTVINGTQRYLASTSQPPVDLCGPNGTVRFFDGAWHLMLGRGLFQIATGPGAPVPHGGATCGVGAGVTWNATAGIEVSGSSLTKTAADGWTTDAQSTEQLTGNGSVQFTVGETTTYKMVGLTSYVGLNGGYQNIDFAFFLTADAAAEIYEDGALVANVGSYATSDVFGLEVNDGVVTYLKNRAVLYTSAHAPKFPIVLQASLYSQGATLNGRIDDTSYWQSPVGVDVSGHNLTKIVADGWNAGAFTVSSLAADGTATFTTAEADTYKMVGLTHAVSDSGYATIDFALFLTAQGLVDIYEQGAYVATVGSYAPNDVLGLQVSGGVVTYVKNGAVLYTSTKTPTFPLFLDASLYSNGATINDVTLSSAPFWQNAVGVSVSSTSITKTDAVSGWNAGASTIASLAGDGSATFTTGETTTYKMVGLTHAVTGSGYATIDYGFFLTAQGSVSIYEDGTLVAAEGSYAATDVFAIKVAGGVVTYLQNGAVLYTSTKAPTFPLFVDASLYSNGATVESVTLSP